MDPAAGKRRLRDVLAVRGYERVDGLILGGFVFVNDERVSSPALYVTTADTIEVRGLKEFVSRSGAKLSGALSEFHISPRGFVCLDLGASTGGFTQVLLQSGAFHVYAVDVGYGIIDYGIRQNAAVTVLDRTDARQVAKEWFSDTHWELIQSSGLFVTCDISFMSIRSVLQPLSLFLKKSHVAMRGVFLLKPQYENSKATEGGIIRDDVVREEIKSQFLLFAAGLGFETTACVPAQIKGAKGNQEFVVYLRFPGTPDAAALPP